jgi:yecA family protein
MANKRRGAIRAGRSVLATFLADPSRPARTLQYQQLQGFLFAVTSSPEIIHPSEWMPIVFGDREAQYRDLGEAQSIVGELMSLYNPINASVAAGTPALPVDCAFRDDVLENFAPDAPVSQWCQGFTLGHDWLRGAWDAYVPDDDDEFGIIVLVLSFFTNRRLAEAYRAELKLPQSLETIARTMRDEFVEALCDYARLGRLLSSVVAEDARPTPRRIGTARTGRKTRRR